MPNTPRPLPAHLGDAFRVSVARASGASAGRLRAGDLASPFWGVRQRRDPRTEVPPDDTSLTAAARLRALAYAPRLSPLAFYVGRSAALLLRIPVPVDDLTVHVGALPLIRGGAMSRPEVHLRLDLADAGLPEPELDVEVRTDVGILLGISEIAFTAWRVAVEYEGDHHRTDRRQWNRDIEKYDAYRRAGWDVVRITRAHLYGTGGRPPTAVQRVRDALVRAGWREPHRAADGQ